MELRIKTNRKPLMLAVRVLTKSPQKIVIKIRDARKPYTFYTNRWNTVNGDALFYIRMPQSPDSAKLIVFNKRKGDVPKGVDRSFRVAEVKKLPLPKQFTCVDADSKIVNRFIQFAQEFSENAGILSAGRSIYESDDGEFRIDYLNVIKNRKGHPMKTPARISQSRGVIEISKWHFKRYTVPMRMAILLHEFSHFYVNKEPSNETEADLQALIIYLGLGYPKIEAHEAFLKVFQDVPTDGNRKRYEILSEFIENFEEFKFKKCN